MSVSSRYFNKVKRTSYLGKLPALSLDILFFFKNTELTNDGGLYFLVAIFIGHFRQYWVYEPQIEISNNVVCAINKGSDQPAHVAFRHNKPVQPPLSFKFPNDFSSLTLIEYSSD